MCIDNLDFKRLNQLLDYEIGFSLHVFDDRYSRGFIAILTFDQIDDQFQLIHNQFNGGDIDNIEAVDYFMDNDWFPIACGEDFQIAISKLICVINSIPDESLSKWINVVKEATINYIKKIENTIPPKTLPLTFEEIK